MTSGAGFSASESWQHASQDLEAQVLLVAEAIRPSLDDAHFVVESLDESQRHLVLGLAVGGDPVPMAFDHLGKLLVGLEALPLERAAPVLEEAPRPSPRARSPTIDQRIL